MASVILDFVPPDSPDFTQLLIYEAPDKDSAPGPLIETVNFPAGNYPTRYTTSLATSNTKWFSIQWKDAKGGASPVSDPVQGGTTTVVAILVERILLRDPTINENLAAQLAEWVIGRTFNTDDPFSVDPATVTFDQWEGMTLLAMARAYISTIVTQSSGESYVAGLISQKAETGGAKKTDAIKFLLDEANALLGTAFPVVMLLEDISPIAMTSISGVELDITRLAITLDV